ncbi:MAG: hypothetical protein QXU28_05510 [Nitrososphaerota archaeon]
MKIGIEKPIEEDRELKVEEAEESRGGELVEEAPVEPRGLDSLDNPCWRIQRTD